MFIYNSKEHNYRDALELKHPAEIPAAKKHNTQQTEINMKFDTVEDAAGFTMAVFSENKEKIFINQPDFMNPRKAEFLRRDYSDQCFIM